MMLVSTVTTVIANADRRRGAIDAERADYLGYLSDVRAAVVNTATAQHQSLFWCHPDPDSLWTLVGGCRMWERRASDSDFCQVRIGLGTLPLATRLVPPTMETINRDPVAVTALHRFLRTHSTVPNVPITLALRELAAVSVGGDMIHVRALLRAALCQLAVMHSPRLVLIAAAVSDHNRRYWDWLKWLPHNRHPHVNDDVGPARLVYASLAAAIEALAGVTADRLPADPVSPHVVVVVDGDVDDTERVNSAAGNAITTLTIDDTAPAGTLRLRVSDSEVLIRTSIDDEVAARPDAMSYTAALACNS
jgi:S-DNA-T family DNA segregation ATPase FtsK/SpoIIIE